MSRILIVNNNMHIGGVQRALVNLLGKISSTNDVTLLLLYKGGELLDWIPDTVTVVEACRSLRYWGMSKFDVNSMRQLLGRSYWAALTRLFGRGFSFRLAARSQQKLPGYDVAISYLHSGNPKAFYGGCAEFVLHLVDAKRTICFLHNDFKRINALSEYNSQLYASFDVIAACSEGCRQSFIEVMPALADKVQVVPNCIGYGKIKRMAVEKSVAVDPSCVNIVTVARLGREKGVVRAIKALSPLIRQNSRLHYYVIGDGVERQAAEMTIQEMGLEDSITLMGEQVNPYPLVSACDLLLIPSYAEAAPLVINEAACLGVPVLSTKTSSASEMVEKTGIGWVCENSDQALREALASLLSNPQKIESRHAALLSKTFDDDDAMECFEDLLVGRDDAC